MITELWTKNNTMTLKTSMSHIMKYKHLLKWKNSESILEVGCGDGTNAKQVILPILPKDYKEFHISDKEPNFVKYIERNVTIPKLKVFKQDVVEDEVPKELENRFDHIFGFFFLHMLMDPRKALVNIHKMLKPGGQTFFNFFEYTPINKVMQNMAIHPKWGKYEHKENAYCCHENPLEAYTQDFITAGFKDAIYNTEKETWEFDEGPEWENLLVSVNSVLSELPESDKEEYIRDYVEYCRAVGPTKVKTADGKWIRKVDRNMFVVVANKT
ncbi:juvenile hormone acid O-methyltransferase-like isoform X2 [Diorhabda carinulata]|uniref:juvenile hormone acid O-methyltransferase-like isoform X2 n=1 Tax=Diorhabda carinulata TaxID=1163345 RepID=UPI0025A07317|nr:juvenile hormone acid O-methyltransferase-like isoform X2 [Diorhabda carinulata]